MKTSVQRIRARPSCHIYSDHFSEVTFRFALVVLLSRTIITTNEWTCSHMLPWSSIIFKHQPRLSSFLPSEIRENDSNKSQARRIAVAASTAFTGSYTENPFWYQNCDLRQIGMLRCDQPIVDFYAGEKCRLCNTRLKAMNFQDDILSIPFENFKDHYVQVFGFISIQTVTENCP